MQISGDDIIYMTATIYGEARGEYFLGKTAVAHVILNRVKADTWYGKTVKDVCLKPWQFSVWNPNDPNREKLEYRVKHVQAAGMQHWMADDDMRECLTAALMAVQGKAEDMTNGATHYFNPRVVDTPAWAKKAELVGAIGNHRFYKNVE